MAVAPRDKPVHLARMEHARSTHTLTPAPNLGWEDVLTNDYWEHVAERLKVGDIVEFFPEGAAWHMRLWLISRTLSPTGYPTLKWRILSLQVFDQADAPSTPGRTPAPARQKAEIDPARADQLVVEHAGSGQGFRILDTGVSGAPAVLVAGCATKQEAEKEKQRILREEAA